MFWGLAYYAKLITYNLHYSTKCFFCKIMKVKGEVIILFLCEEREACYNV